MYLIFIILFNIHVFVIFVLCNKEILKMKYAFIITENNPNNSFESISQLFSREFFDSYDVNKGKELLYEMGKYIKKYNILCDKIIIDCFTYKPFMFALILKCGKKNIATFKIEVKFNSFLNLVSYSYSSSFKNEYREIIENFFFEYNNTSFNCWLSLCNIKENEENYIELINYVNYNPKNILVLKGCLSKIFDNYTSINNLYKSCDGYYVTFKNKNITTLYEIYTSFLRKSIID